MTIRKATMADADFLLMLKNDPVMRKYAVVTHRTIKKAEHISWLRENIHTIKIIEEAGQLVGMLRVTDDKEVSINISPECRGQGLGGKILAAYCPKKVWAKIVNGNVPSMRIFLANGFKIVDYEKNYYVLEN